jgi:hypothetical protein
MGDAMNLAFKHLGIERKMKEIAAKEAWAEIVGTTFAKATSKISIYNNVMFVKVLSPAIRYELMHNRRNITRRINETVGEEIIVDIVVK